MVKTMTNYIEDDKIYDFFANKLLFELKLETNPTDHANFDTALVIILQNFESSKNSKIFTLRPIDIIKIIESFKINLKKYIIENNINEQSLKPRITPTLEPISKRYIEFQIKYYFGYNQKESIEHFSKHLNFILNVQTYKQFNFNQGIIYAINHIKNHQYRLQPDDIIKGLKNYIEKIEEIEKIKYIKEEIIPHLDSIKDDLKVEWTLEKEREIRKMSEISIEDLFRPFNI